MRFFAPFFLSLILVGCGTSVRTSAPARPDGRSPLTRSLQHPADTDPYPADVGRHWTYQTWQTQGGQPEKPGKEQRMVVERSVDEGQVMRRFLGTWEAPPTLIRRSPDAVVLSRFFADGPQATESITILKLPVTPGQEWPGRTFVGASERIAVVGLEQVVVPAGRFDTWHVRHYLQYDAGGGDTLDYWYAGGVGMVRCIERITLQTGGQPLKMQVRALLTQYGR